MHSQEGSRSLKVLGGGDDYGDPRRDRGRRQMDGGMAGKRQCRRHRWDYRRRPAVRAGAACGIRKLDRHDNVSVYLEDTHGAGAVAIDSKGRILVVERTCTDPGRSPAQCAEPTAVAVLAPERKVLADNIEGKGLGDSTI